jgi:hypothetical protein
MNESKEMANCGNNDVTINYGYLTVQAVQLMQLKHIPNTIFWMGIFGISLQIMQLHLTTSIAISQYNRKDLLYPTYI